MRFEALHQKFKRYAKFCGFKNVGITMAKKFQKLQSLYFSGTDSFKIHPLLDEDIVCHYSRSKVTAISFFGKKIPSKKNIVLTYENNGIFFGIVEEWSKIDGNLTAKIEKIDKISFSNELLAYEIKKTGEFVSIDVQTVMNSFGEIYKFENKDFALFNQGV